MSDVFQGRDDAAGEGNGSDKVIRKIRALLRKASANGVTDAERDSYNAKAAEIAAKHKVDMARATAAGTADGDELALSPYTFYDETHKEQASLMYRISVALGCESIHNPDEADPEFESSGLTVIGYLSDVKRAELFFEQLYLQMISAALRFANHKDRRTFMQGFAHEIGDRIKAAENKARSDDAPAGSGAALVLASRDVAVKKAFKEEFPHVGRQRVGGSADAFEAGRAAGKSANLGGTSVGNKRAALVG